MSNKLIVVLVAFLFLLDPPCGFASNEIRDPTRPPHLTAPEKDTGTVATSSAYKLTAILVAQGRRIAVINGQPVKTGDQIANAEVVSIQKDKVMLRSPRGDRTLRLFSRSIKTSEAAGQ